MPQLGEDLAHGVTCVFCVFEYGVSEAVHLAVVAFVYLLEGLSVVAYHFSFVIFGMCLLPVRHKNVEIKHP